MKIKAILVSLCLGNLLLTAQVTRKHDLALKNWPVPLYWQPSQAEADAVRARLNPAIRPPAPEAATPVGSLVFVAMTPCRVVDTRTSQMFPAPFGMPILAANATRSFPIQSSTQCSIPSIAQAYSFNVTVIPPAALGYLTIWPSGQPQPNAVTLDDFPTGDIRNNAAIVPAGTPNGSVDVHVNATTEFVLDINGYFAPSTGIALAQGTAAAPSLSFSGDAGTGIFSAGMGILNLTTGGMTAVTVRADGDLDLPGSIRKTGTLFLHNLGTRNTGVGLSTLAVNTGSFNTATGNFALPVNTTGNDNTANGDFALGNNTTGIFNTAMGGGALFHNIIGSHNSAIGGGTLFNNTGSNNTGIGDSALVFNTSGNNNIALGFNAGMNITTTSKNIDIGNDGVAGDASVIRIGTAGTHTLFFAAGISGVMTGAGSSNVLIDSNGQLGTVPSSRRYKEDIQDMDDASDGLLRLRPVTFRYQKPYADGSKPIDYGLIAEEVAEVYPDLVVRSPDGRIETVQYHKLAPMLLNELQKERRKREIQDETIQTLQLQLSALEKTVERLNSSR